MNGIGQKENLVCAGETCSSLFQPFQPLLELFVVITVLPILGKASKSKKVCKVVSKKKIKKRWIQFRAQMETRGLNCVGSCVYFSRDLDLSRILDTSGFWATVTFEFEQPPRV
eukprot:EG_transcript_42077